LVLVIVGHDLLMTANAHGVMRESASASVETHHAGDSALASGSAASGVAASPASNPDRNCETVRVAAPPSGLASTLDGGAAAIAPDARESLPSVAGPLRSFPPTRPPDTRRALLQVYRI
jgi:hypothetical protein